MFKLIALCLVSVLLLAQSTDVMQVEVDAVGTDNSFTYRTEEDWKLDRSKRDAVVYFKSASDNPQLVGQRLRSQIVAALTRFFIAFERRWYDLLAESSPAEVNFGIFTGFVLTFLAVWLSLSALLNALNPVPLPLSRSFQEYPSMEAEQFAYDEGRWIDAVHKWVETASSEGSYRCCIHPESRRNDGGVVRCSPLLWTSTMDCSSGLFRDVVVDPPSLNVR